MLATLGRRVIVEPVPEKPSDIIIVPDRKSRWKNGKLSICGRVVAVGRPHCGVGLGDYVYYSDSCAHPINGGDFAAVHEDDIMFISDTLQSVQWLGAEESYDD